VGSANVGAHGRNLDQDADRDVAKNLCQKALIKILRARRKGFLSPTKPRSRSDGQHQSGNDFEEHEATVLHIERDTPEDVPAATDSKDQGDARCRGTLVHGHCDSCRHRHSAAGQQCAARHELADDLEEDATGNVAHAERSDGVATC
jgi:hypothetical protein